MNSRSASTTQVALIVIVVAGMAVDAFVHFDLASAFKNVKTSTLSEADMFRAEASVAVIAAVAVLVRPRRYTAAFAFLVAAAGFVAVIVTRYVNIGALGPIPERVRPLLGPHRQVVQRSGGRNRGGGRHSRWYGCCTLGRGPRRPLARLSYTRAVNGG